VSRYERGSLVFLVDEEGEVYRLADISCLIPVKDIQVYLRSPLLAPTEEIEIERS